MSRQILSIESNDARTPKASANLLPCRVHRDGPVDDVQPFWQPAKMDDGKRTAYFRGRQLHGRTVALPEGYRGVVVGKSDKTPESQRRGDALEQASGDVEEAVEEGPELGSMQVKAGFDEVVVWGHESLADAATDPYVRSMEEWVQVAEKIHAYPTQEGDAPK